MFQLPKIPFLSSLPSFRTSRNIPIPAAPINDIETSSDRRARTLKHLIKANHVNYSIIYHDLRYHNHTSHILGSAYLLGATSERLNEIYDQETKQLEGWRDAPGEVTGGDWRVYLGRKEYQRAFVDFFEDALVQHNYDWKQMLHHFLFEGDNPIINNLVAGLGHPLIHLGYGYELNSQTVSIEALAMACCFYDDLHKYLDEPEWTRPPEPGVGSEDLFELLQRMAKDERFEKLGLKHPGEHDAQKRILAQTEDVVLEYWNAWTLTTDPKEAFHQSQRAAAALLVATPHEKGRFDFYILHLLTTSHALRILLPLIPAQFEIPLLRQWWLCTILTYIAQLRPSIDLRAITDYDTQGRDWKFVDHEALSGKNGFDPHYVKALRAMKEAERVWGTEDGFWVKAAVRFAAEFERYGGFGVDGEGERVENGRFE